MILFASHTQNIDVMCYVCSKVCGTSQGYYVFRVIISWNNMKKKERKRLRMSIYNVYTRIMRTEGWMGANVYTWVMWLLSCLCMEYVVNNVTLYFITSLCSQIQRIYLKKKKKNERVINIEVLLKW